VWEGCNLRTGRRGEGATLRMATEVCNFGKGFNEAGGDATLARGSAGEGATLGRAEWKGGCNFSEWFNGGGGGGRGGGNRHQQKNYGPTLLHP
jgi:hypothetical protein